jgi:HD-like signal output (HDOD) protein
MYARQKEITKLQQAITLLGLKTIKSLVILATASSMFSKNKKTPFYQMFWRHSLVTAFMARDLAVRVGTPSLAEEAFVAGLLHNIGQVAFFMADPSSYDGLIAQAFQPGKRISALEDQSFGVNHKVVGSQVLAGWNFPPVYSDTALEHANANITSPHKQVVILVSTAGFLASNLDMRKGNPEALQRLEPNLPFLGLWMDALRQFAEGYMARLAGDKLFLECQNLFSLQMSGQGGHQGAM